MQSKFRRVKKDLTREEQDFIVMYACEGNVSNAARTHLSKVVRNPIRKAYKLLEYPVAREFLREQKERIAKQIEEEFSQESRRLLKNLLEQARGTQSTKRIQRQSYHPKSGVMELEEKYYDKLAAISRVVSIAGLDKRGNESPVTIDEVFEVRLD